MQFVVNFYEENPLIVKKITDLFGENFIRDTHYDVIKGISENRRLFNKYCRGEFEKYHNFYQALAITNATPDAILVYFTDLKLYAVVNSLEKFKDFTSNMDDITEAGENINVNQIILNNQKQKLVFVCSGNSEPTVQKLQKYVHEYLHNDSTVTKTGESVQITVESEVYDSYNDAIGKFACLQSHIRMKDDQLAQIISTMPLQAERPYIYTSPALILPGKLAELIGALKTPVNITINNINGNNNIVGNNNNMKIEKQLSNRELADNWILNNPPEDREITTNYYNRYVENVNKPIHINQFSGLVRAAGFEIVRGTDCRHWTKKIDM